MANMFKMILCVPCGKDRPDWWFRGGTSDTCRYHHAISRARARVAFHEKRILDAQAALKREDAAQAAKVEAAQLAKERQDL